MPYILYFTDKSKEDIDFFKKSGNKSVLKKLFSLLEELYEHPFTGTGKPEQLKYQLSSQWSRRINKEHRLVYRFDEYSIEIIQLRFHY